LKCIPPPSLCCAVHHPASEDPTAAKGKAAAARALLQRVLSFTQYPHPMMLRYVSFLSSLIYFGSLFRTPICTFDCDATISFQFLFTRDSRKAKTKVSRYRLLLTIRERGRKTGPSSREMQSGHTSRNRDHWGSLWGTEPPPKAYIGICCAMKTIRTKRKSNKFGDASFRSLWWVRRQSRGISHCKALSRQRMKQIPAL
jgi:hypothetical protein